MNNFESLPSVFVAKLSVHALEELKLVKPEFPIYSNHPDALEVKRIWVQCWWTKNYFLTTDRKSGYFRQSNTSLASRLHGKKLLTLAEKVYVGLYRYYEKKVRKENL